MDEQDGRVLYQKAPDSSGEILALMAKVYIEAVFNKVSAAGNAVDSQS
jgi:hypothetical protein